MAGRYEKRDVFEPIGIQAPQQGQEELAASGNDEARPERQPLVKFEAREHVKQRDPRHDADQDLSWKVDTHVERQRDRQKEKNQQAVGAGKSRKADAHRRIVCRGMHALQLAGATILSRHEPYYYFWTNHKP